VLTRSEKSKDPREGTSMGVKGKVRRKKEERAQNQYRQLRSGIYPKEGGTAFTASLKKESHYQIVTPRTARKRGGAGHATMGVRRKKRGGKVEKSSKMKERKNLFQLREGNRAGA